MGGILAVAAGAVEGFGTIYNGLEESATILGQNLSNNSVKIIEHKYGPSAGCVAADTFDTVGNMINLSKNINIITPKGLARKTMKGTGKAIFSDFRPKVVNGKLSRHVKMLSSNSKIIQCFCFAGQRYVPASALYPDLTEFSKQVAQPKI